MPNKLMFLTGFILVAAAAVFVWAGRSGEPVTGESAATADVAVPPLDATTKLGERLYNDNCASCHGVNAAGQQGIAPPLIHKIYEPGHHADGAFYLAVQQGVRAHHWPFGDMPPVEGLTLGDVGKIVAYIRLVQQTNGIQ